MRKLFRLLCFIFIVLPLMLSAALYLLLATPSFQKECVEKLSNMLSIQTGMSITMSRVLYQFPFTVILDDLAVTHHETPIKLKQLHLIFKPYELIQHHIVAGSILAQIEDIELAGTFSYNTNQAFTLKLNEREGAKGQIYGEINVNSTKEFEHSALHLKMAPFTSHDLFFRYGLEADVAFSGSIDQPLVSSTCLVKRARVHELEIEHLFAHLTLNATGGIKVIIDGKSGAYLFKFMTSLEQPVLISLPFSMILDSSDEQEPIFQMSGLWSYSSNALSLKLSSFQGKTPFKLTNHPEIEITPASIKTTPLMFQIGSGLLETKWSLSSSAMHGSLEFNQLSLDLLHPYIASLQLEAKASGKAEISGSILDPKISIDINLNAPSHSNFNSPSFVVHLKGAISKARALLSGSLALSGQSPISCNASLPVICTLSPFEMKLLTEEPFSAHLYSASEIEPLMHLLQRIMPGTLEESLNLSGSITTDLTLNGTLQQPECEGVCDIQDGSLEDASSGAYFSQLNAHFSLKGKNLSLDRLTAADRSGGTLSGTGTLELIPEKSFPHSLTLRLAKLQFLDLDFVKAYCSGSVQVQGNMKHSAASGTLNMEEALFHIPDKRTSGIDTIDVTYINLIENAPLPQMMEHLSSEWPFTLNLTLKIPSTLAIEGADLTSLWKGELQVSGTAKSPLVFGQLQVEKGHYNFSGKPFEIKQGTITFEGDPEKKTSFYVIASRNLDRVKVEVIFKGHAKKPSISFRSNPPLPQREILSWILFNRGAAEISSFEGRELNETITNLDNVQQNSGMDFLTKLQKTLGIDRFEISQDEHSKSSQMSVQVGKYISENLYISINRSDVSRIALEAALTDKVKMQAEIGDDSEGRLLIKWKRDY